MFTKTLLLTVLFAVKAWAFSANGSEFCVGPYALCAAARCVRSGNNTDYVDCSCEGPLDGLNVGAISCKARTESLRSTYSIAQRFTSDIQPQLHQFNCEGSHNEFPWADCSNAHCNLAQGVPICECPLQPAGPNIYTGVACPTSKAQMKEFCMTLRESIAPKAGVFSQRHLMTTFYGNPPPKIKECDVGNLPSS